MASSLPAVSSAIKKAILPQIEAGNGVKFAVVYCTNLQYKVSPGDIIAVQRLHAEIGSTIALKKVAMVGGARFTAIGRPFLSNCRVVAEVEEHKRMKTHLYFKPHKGRHSTTARDCLHPATILRISSVIYDPPVVGALCKDTGILLPETDPRVLELLGNGSNVGMPVPDCHWKDEISADTGL